jgi:hypothetical protein
MFHKTSLLKGHDHQRREKYLQWKLLSLIDLEQPFKMPPLNATEIKFMVSQTAPVSALFNYSLYQKELLDVAEKCQDVWNAIYDRSMVLQLSPYMHFGWMYTRYGDYLKDLQKALKIKNPDNKISNRVYTLLHIRDCKDFDPTVIKTLSADDIGKIVRGKNVFPQLIPFERTELAALRALKETDW